MIANTLFRCRGTDCTAVSAFVVTKADALRSDVDVEAIVRRAVCVLGWYPLTRCDYLCPDCGWARYLRNDRDAKDARMLRDTLSAVLVTGRAA